MICLGTLSFRKRLDSWFEDNPRTEDIAKSEFIDNFTVLTGVLFSCQEPRERTEENGRSKF
jgi:hypothetical protein